MYSKRKKKSLVLNTYIPLADKILNYSDTYLAFYPALCLPLPLTHTLALMRNSSARLFWRSKKKKMPLNTCWHLVLTILKHYFIDWAWFPKATA